MTYQQLVYYVTYEGGVPDVTIEAVAKPLGQFMVEQGLITEIQSNNGKLDWEATVNDVLVFMTDSEKRDLVNKAKVICEY